MVLMLRLENPVEGVVSARWYEMFGRNEGVGLWLVLRGGIVSPGSKFRNWVEVVRVVGAHVDVCLVVVTLELGWFELNGWRCWARKL